MSAVEDRKEIEELLPFFVNGTLQPDERARVETALAEDQDHSADAVWLEALRAQVQVDLPANSPGEFGLARLMRDVDREAAQTIPVQRRFAPALWGALAASVVAVAFVMSGILGVGEPTFEQASGAQVDEGISVIFQPGLDVESLSVAVHDLGLVIVDGPSAMGVYRVAPIEGEDLATLAEALQARADLFEFVESLE